MSDADHSNWKPSPELLAAFADGELDARDDAAPVRAKLEAWLDKNPHAQAELLANTRLKKLFDRTRPAAPSSQAWRETLDRIHNHPVPPAARTSPSAAWFLGGAAAAACLLWAVLLAGSYWRAAPETEVFAVATDNDVEILHVEGDAIDGLVVGMLPLNGVLQMAEPGEVAVTSVTPARRDNMLPTVHIEGPRRPMIWAKLEGEGE